MKRGEARGLGLWNKLLLWREGLMDRSLLLDGSVSRRGEEPRLRWATTVSMRRRGGQSSGDRGRASVSGLTSADPRPSNITVPHPSTGRLSLQLLEKRVRRSTSDVGWKTCQNDKNTNYSTGKHILHNIHDILTTEYTVLTVSAQKHQHI